MPPFTRTELPELITDEMKHDLIWHAADVAVEWNTDPEIAWPALDRLLRARLRALLLSEEAEARAEAGGSAAVADWLCGPEG